VSGTPRLSRSQGPGQLGDQIRRQASNASPPTAIPIATAAEALPASAGTTEASPCSQAKLAEWSASLLGHSTNYGLGEAQTCRRLRAANWRAR